MIDVDALYPTSTQVSACRDDARSLVATVDADHHKQIATLFDQFSVPRETL